MIGEVKSVPKARPGPAPGEEPPVTASDLLDVVRRRAGVLIANVAGVTLLALAVSLLLPKWYEGRAVLLPPTEADLGTSAIAQMLPSSIGRQPIPANAKGDDAIVVLEI